MSSKTDYLNKVDQQDYYDLGSCYRKCVRAPLCWMAQYSLNIHPLVALTIDYNHYTWKSNCLPLKTKTIAKDHMRSKQFEIKNNLWWRILWLKDWVSESNRLSNDSSFAIHFTKLSVLLTTWLACMSLGTFGTCNIIFRLINWHKKCPEFFRINLNLMWTELWYIL